MRELVVVPEEDVYWTPPPRPAPRLRITGRQIACPRQALAAIVEPSRYSYAELSRMIRRRPGYLACFVREGHPLALRADDHRMLAGFFGVTERSLGIRDLYAWDAA